MLEDLSLAPGGEPDPDPVTSRILGFVRAGERRRWPGRPRRSFTLRELADRLELDPAACCRALYALVHRGDLDVHVRTDGRFALLPGPSVRA